MCVLSAEIAQTERHILNVKYMVRDRAYDVVKRGESLGEACDNQRVSVPFHALTCFQAGLHTSAKTKEARGYGLYELPVNAEGIPHRTLVDGMDELYRKFFAIVYTPCRVTPAGLGVAQFEAWFGN